MLISEARVPSANPAASGPAADTIRCCARLAKASPWHRCRHSRAQQPCPTWPQTRTTPPRRRQFQRRHLPHCTRHRLPFSLLRSTPRLPWRWRRALVKPHRGQRCKSGDDCRGSGVRNHNGLHALAVPTVFPHGAGRRVPRAGQHCGTGRSRRRQVRWKPRRLEQHAGAALAGWRPRPLENLYWQLGPYRGRAGGRQRGGGWRQRRRGIARRRWSLI